jgi:hypothetical protein
MGRNPGLNLTAPDVSPGAQADDLAIPSPNDPWAVLGSNQRPPACKAADGMLERGVSARSALKVNSKHGIFWLTRYPERYPAKGGTLVVP